VAEVAELDLVSDSLRCASLACGAVAAGRPARCPALAALALERPRLALPHVPGLAALRRLHLGRRCEARARAPPPGRGQPARPALQGCAPPQTRRGCRPLVARIRCRGTQGCKVSQCVKMGVGVEVGLG